MCKQEKESSAFARSSVTQDRLQRGCKECKAEQYKRNSGKYKEGSRQARVKRFNRLAEIKSQPCVDCGIQYPPYVMEFDHVRGEKIHKISWMITNVSWSILEDEIKKCDLVCANCHKERTYSRLRANGKACHY